MTIKPMSYLREKIVLMAIYHPKVLILCTFCVALLITALVYIVFWPLTTPEYIVSTLSLCDNFDMKITHPSRVLPDTEYTISWQVPDEVKVVPKFNSPLVTLIQLAENEISFKVKRTRGWRYQIPLTFLVSINDYSCSVFLTLTVYPWLKMTAFILSGISLLGMLTLIMEIVKGLTKVYST